MEFKKPTIEQIMQAAEASIMDGEYIGICQKCSEETSGIEPDAEGVRCENCNAYEVCGAEILLMGISLVE